jgi:hypothetical protein
VVGAGDHHALRVAHLRDQLFEFGYIAKLVLRAVNLKLKLHHDDGDELSLLASGKPDDSVVNSRSVAPLLSRRSRRYRTLAVPQRIHRATPLALVRDWTPSAQPRHHSADARLFGCLRLR